MASKPSALRDRRKALKQRIDDLAERAVFGTLSKAYRACGNPSCRCRRGGPKHGPHLSISFRSGGKTTGFHVPVAAEERIRAGVAAWWDLQDCLRELADMNKDAILAEARKKAGP